jgi:hypothetical protein
MTEGGHNNEMKKKKKTKQNKTWQGGFLGVEVYPPLTPWIRPCLTQIKANYFI